MINVTELKVNNYFVEEGALYQVMDVALNKTAMRKMVVKLKVKNVRTGAISEMSRNSGYAIETVKIDKKKMQYLYDSGDALVFMDQATYEQIELPKSNLEWELQFLRGDEEVDISSFEGEVLGIVLPAKVTLKITQCEPGIKGDSVNKAMKDAVLETGLKVRVPLFIDEGEEIIVRTDNGQYDGRAN